MYEIDELGSVKHNKQSRKLHKLDLISCLSPQQPLRHNPPSKHNGPTSCCQDRRNVFSQNPPIHGFQTSRVFGRLSKYLEYHEPAFDNSDSQSRSSRYSRRSHNACSSQDVPATSKTQQCRVYEGSTAVSPEPPPQSVHRSRIKSTLISR